LNYTAFGLRKIIVAYQIPSVEKVIIVLFDKLWFIQSKKDRDNLMEK